MGKPESDLCEWFIAMAKARGWTCYPETSDWDILLVRDSVQIGVQAKMTPNVKLLKQCLPQRHRYGTSMLAHPERFKDYGTGPDYRVALVPRKGKGGALRDFSAVAKVLGIWVVARGDASSKTWRTKHDYGTAILEDQDRMESFFWEPAEHCWTPDVVPDVEAGIKSPVSLTRWKQAAMRFIARAELNGYVTSKDAREFGISMKRFTARFSSEHEPWMRFIGKTGRLHKYELCGEDPERPDKQMPEAYEYFLEEARKQNGNV